MSMAAVSALNEYRLAHDFSWQQLADAMAEHGFPLSPRTLHNILKGGHIPRDRTLYKLKKFLETVDGNSFRRRAVAAR